MSALTLTQAGRASVALIHAAPSAGEISDALERSRALGNAELHIIRRAVTGAAKDSCAFSFSGDPANPGAFSPSRVLHAGAGIPLRVAAEAVAAFGRRWSAGRCST